MISCESVHFPDLPIKKFLWLRKSPNVRFGLVLNEKFKQI